MSVDTRNCQAVSPPACKYHGSALRMEEALRSGRMGDYLTARSEFEEEHKRLIKKNLFGFGASKDKEQPLDVDVLLTQEEMERERVTARRNALDVRNIARAKQSRSTTSLTLRRSAA